MAKNNEFNKLYSWLHSAGPETTVIGGSATPGLSLNDLVKLSNDPDNTQAAFQFNDINFNLGSGQGNLNLRETIAATYNHESSKLSASDIIVANGTTGSNHIVHQSLLKPGDHIICQYPIYGPCIEEPEHIGCEISYLCLDPEKNWQFDLSQLEALIQPGKTKLLMLNNPVNPTGTYFNTKLQGEVVSLCKKHDVTLHCDEIFRPLFHDATQLPHSFIEHQSVDYDKVVVTSSLSKAYGLSGVRIGWIATRSAALQRIFLNYRLISCHSVSTLDEAIAAEALSTRCRPGIIDKHLAMAKKNIDILQALVNKHSDVCDWVPPTAGAVGFIRFKNLHTGVPVNDVEFCKDLFASKNVLLAPATMCFEFEAVKNKFKGRARIHFTTTTEKLQKGVALLGEFLEEKKADADSILSERL